MLSTLKKLTMISILLTVVSTHSIACDQMCPNDFMYDKIEIIDEEFSDKIQAVQDKVFQDQFGSTDIKTLGYIFVSTSMPLKTLIQYELDAQKYGFHLIMQGLVNDSYKETMLYLAEFVKETKGGISINPELFQTFKIEQVPTIILNQGKQSDIMKGNVTLEYALKAFSKSGDLKENAEKALKGDV